jgi:hypothetical protein
MNCSIIDQNQGPDIDCLWQLLVSTCNSLVITLHCHVSHNLQGLSSSDFLGLSISKKTSVDSRPLCQHHLGALVVGSLLQSIVQALEIGAHDFLIRSILSKI